MELNASDFLNAFANLDESQKLMKDTVRKFVTEIFLPNITLNFEQGYFPKEFITELGKLGLLGCNLTGYGCAGLDEVSYGLIMKELERGDSGLRSFASVQSSLAMYAIHAFGSEEQKNTFLPLMAKGERIGCFGLTEPDFGSNPAGMKTYAKKDSGDWILNGSKTWITNAPIADVAVVWAQTDEGIRGFLIEKGTKGFSAPEIKHKLSLRASITGSLFFDQCRIPKKNLLENTVGLKNALMCLNQARFGIVFGVLGAAEDCLQEAIQYTKERIMFKRPLAGYQLIQRKLAIMATEIAKGNLLAMQLAHLKHIKKLHPAQISMGKQNNVQIALDCARTARDILGANGISGEYRSMRHMCNLESVYTYEGTNDIHLLIVGEKLTGLSAFE
ncbi:acyl-CoA dehydrogenase family protein [Pigmentibacter ruber]|uniref:acyl-CoA dehydrogenase family protein n=1 Tax=Pigmentibacter ruber TaxID=2683196 RepID=UPI00131EB815|nr:acyl-CoA dehydrogenase family protein [Pigmentibacter ruber]BFD32990.1 acyl-CoA dehydrogenase family protein [Pigmentibacter ruber]